jgi:hypothetical protein
VYKRRSFVNPISVPKYRKKYLVYAREYGVSEITIKRWAKKKYPLDDVAALCGKVNLPKITAILEGRARVRAAMRPLLVLLEAELPGIIAAALEKILHENPDLITGQLADSAHSQNQSSPQSPSKLTPQP